MKPIENRGALRPLSAQGKLATTLTLGVLATGFSAFGSGDYGPAIWNPACSGHWYTSGNGHRFHVIHDMEGYYLTTISYFKNCSTTASVHYCVNGKQDAASDAPAGEITQMVADANYAWHVRCWNTYCTGTEHEGFANNPSWYTDLMYESSAGISRHEAIRNGFPMDGGHICGHNAWQSASWRAWAPGALGIDPNCNSHTDPGTYWNWNHYLALVNNVLQGAIVVHYNALGGMNSYLGDPTTSETTTPDGVGRFNHFSNDGSIYWTQNYGAWAVHGLIQDKWSALGWETGPVGYPVTDETGTPDGIGRYNHFKKLSGESGSIYWTPNYGAWSIHGVIRDHWSALGWEGGVLGYPVSDETGTPDGVGRYNHFKNPHTGDTQGSIYWTPNYGAFEVGGAIRSEWANLGWETSVLGYPVTDETGTPDNVGRYNHFQTLSQSSPGGSIYWTSATGAHEVHGAIRTQWANMGWERSSLGYPTSDQYALNDGTGRVRNNFQNGTITYNPTTGQVTVP